jgi:hypothetical protein
MRRGLVATVRLHRTNLGIKNFPAHEHPSISGDKLDRSGMPMLQRERCRMSLENGFP